MQYWQGWRARCARGVWSCVRNRSPQQRSPVPLPKSLSTGPGRSSKVALAWQAYGNATREATSLKAISLDVDAVRQSIDRIATNVATGQEQMTRRIEHSIERNTDRLATGQDETTREISDLQTFEQYLLHRISTLPPRPAPATVSKPVLRSPQPPTQLIPARNP